MRTCKPKYLPFIPGGEAGGDAGGEAGVSISGEAGGDAGGEAGVSTSSPSAPVGDIGDSKTGPPLSASRDDSRPKRLWSPRSSGGNRWSNLQHKVRH